MKGLIGKKIGMTSMFVDGTNVACSVLQLGPCPVVQLRTEDTDGYSAVQLGYGDAKEKNVTKPLAGHFKKAKVKPVKVLKEFRDYDFEANVGENITVDKLFQIGDFINVIGTSKGRGFQGVVKRHNFGGVGESTHGQHNRQRHPGAIGACSFPARVFKGLKMAGRMGGERKKVKNLEVTNVFPEKNIIVVTGSVPGHKNSLVIAEKK